jgi:hypothetical protein
MARGNPTDSFALPNKGSVGASMAQAAPTDVLAMNFLLVNALVFMTSSLVGY